MRLDRQRKPCLRAALRRGNPGSACLKPLHRSVVARGDAVLSGETILVEIYVDADACPVKAEVYRVAERHGCKVFVVANSFIGVPRDPLVERVVVASGPDAADDWIAERARPGDVVITADIPLASRAVKAGAAAIAPNGRAFTASSIGMALATRNLMDQLRSTGEITSGPKPFSPRDRSAFLGALDRAIVRARRGSPS